MRYHNRYLISNLISSYWEPCWGVSPLSKNKMSHRGDHPSLHQLVTAWHLSLPPRCYNGYLKRVATRCLSLLSKTHILYQWNNSTPHPQHNPSGPPQTDSHHRLVYYSSETCRKFVTVVTSWWTLELLRRGISQIPILKWLKPVAGTVDTGDITEAVSIYRYTSSLTVLSCQVPVVLYLWCSTCVFHLYYTVSLLYSHAVLAWHF